MAGKISIVRQESEVKQSRREVVGEEYSTSTGKCTAKRRGVIWRKGVRVWT